MLKGATKLNKNETKEQKWRFVSILLDTLGASMLGNILAGRRIVRAGSENKKENELQKLVIEKNGILNASLYFNKLWNTKVLSE